MINNMVELKYITVINNRVEYIFFTNGCFEKYFNSEKRMYIEYDYNMECVPESILAIPFMANILPFIWLCDGTLKIKNIDKEFFENINGIKKGFEEMYPKLEFKGKIIVDTVERNSYLPMYEAAQLFSGGLDAITTFTRIQHKRPLLITHWGADISTDNEQGWNSLKNRVKIFGQEQGVKNVFIKSNYREFLNETTIARDFNRLLNTSWYFGIQHGLVLICASIPILYKLKVKTLYIASSFYEGCEKDYGYLPRCGSHPSIDNNIKFASGNVFHDAYELNRQKKIGEIIKYNKKNGVFLKVCNNENIRGNCCKCEKCYRTIVGIIAEGGDPNSFGFTVDSNIGAEFKKFVDSEIINMGEMISVLWSPIQKRFSENYNNLLYKENFEWFLNCNMKKERDKRIFIYRVTNFIPIVKRKIKNGMRNKNE